MSRVWVFSCLGFFQVLKALNGFSVFRVWCCLGLLGFRVTGVEDLGILGFRAFRVWGFEGLWVLVSLGFLGFRVFRVQGV